MTRWPLLLPVFALALVGALALAVLASRGEDDPGDGGLAASPQGDQASGRPQLQPQGSVCEGLVRRPDPSEPRRFAAQYTKQREVLGIAIIGGDGVPDAAFDEAEKTLLRVFQNNDLEAPLAAEGAYIIILESDQKVIDLPEFTCLSGTGTEAILDHACGVADRADYPVATVNELDLTGSRKGPCGGLNILFHEVGHLVQGWTLDHADYIDVRVAYQQALDAGKYSRAYAATNPNEYFAEATQAYFLHQDSGNRDRDWLQKYDPDLYAILARVYGD
ncbi:MAG: hypothetical protein HY875_07250 [Chloroflexi bacterium]|nr:hypothetical protein [Chloroflexota bacterium]